MIAVAFIFGVPLLVATTMLSPPGLYDVISTTVRYTGLMLVLMPFFAWPIFLTEAIVPSSGGGRLAAVIQVWLGGAALVAAVIGFIGVALDYSANPLNLDPEGHALVPYNPQAGVLLGLFMISMLISTGLWGVVARIFPGTFVIAGALVTGIVMFLVVAGIGYLLWPDQRVVYRSLQLTRHYQNVRLVRLQVHFLHLSAWAGMLNEMPSVAITRRTGTSGEVQRQMTCVLFGPLASRPTIIKMCSPRHQKGCGYRRWDTLGKTAVSMSG